MKVRFSRTRLKGVCKIMVKIMSQNQEIKKEKKNLECIFFLQMSKKKRKEIKRVQKRVQFYLLLHYNTKGTIGFLYTICIS